MTIGHFNRKNHCFSLYPCVSQPQSPVLAAFDVVPYIRQDIFIVHAILRNYSGVHQ